VNIVR
jgi:hypothetical protein